MNKSKTHSNNITPSKWINTQLNLIGYTFTGLSGKNKEDFGFGKPYIPYLNIFNNAIIKDDHFDYVNIKENDNQQKVKHGDIFFTTSSESAEEVGMCSVYLGNADELYLNSFCFGFRISDTENFSPVFLAEYFRSSLGRRIMFRLAQGATRYNLSKTNLLKENITIPPLPEQQKIADILSTWDEAIALTKKTIDNLKDRNKGIAQQLLTGKKRLNGFSEKWQKTNLGKITNRVTTRNEELNDTVVTISAQRGFVLQEDFFNKRVASETLSGYYLLKKGQFAYNKSYSNGYPMGAFKRLNAFEKAVVTTLYICFELKDNANSDFMVHFFENGFMTRNLMKIAKEGGRAHGLLNIGLDDFNGLELFIPGIQEQKAIAQVLETADQELKNYEAKLEQLKLQKKGLMQQLLTGKIRVS